MEKDSNKQGSRTQAAANDATVVAGFDATFNSSTSNRELSDQTLAALRGMLGHNILRLLHLPDGLERDFRADYRSRATAVARTSVYGLLVLYLLVVLPIALFVDAPMQSTWRSFAVYPIGMALLVIWVCTRFLTNYTERSLQLGTFLALAGPIYGFMVLGDGLLGRVAGGETIYVLIVVFTMLMLRTSDVLGCALLAFSVALGAALINHLAIDWVSVFLYFFVPLVICSITGYLLEHVARRNFVQALLHQQDRLRVVNYLARLVSNVDDIGKVLWLALQRICQHNGWPLGRITALADAERVPPVTYVRADLPLEQLHDSVQLWSQPDAALLVQLAAKGEACWIDCGAALKQAMSPQLQLRRQLLFPIKLDNRVLAVLELFCSQEVLPDARLLALMDNVSLQLGRAFEHARQQRELKHKAMHDALTDLPNRAYLFEHLRLEMANARRYTDSSFCVLFVDADHFKWVNDSLGHLAGDKLLVELAARLRRCVRTSDFVARLGGDEFAIVIRVAQDSDKIDRTIECIRGRLLQPFMVENQPILLGLSVGVVMYDPRYSEPEELLRDADTAMYSAKKKGRGRFEVFNLEMHAQMVERLQLTAELRHALDHQEFVLHFQPLVEARGSRISGFEALVRWQHPQQGLLPPARFITLLEETGMIDALTDWVLRQACQQLYDWQRLGDARTSISVNLCASYLAQPDLPDKIKDIADAAHILPERLHLEITETQVMVNAELSMSNISRLRDLGFSISIDDFGTGYSSLNYLANFRVNALKIDKSFLDKMDGGEREWQLVQVIIDLGHQLQLAVIAEGVETLAQLQSLQNMGCDYIQGYVYAKPVSAREAGEMMRQQWREGVGFFHDKVVAG